MQGMAVHDKYIWSTSPYLITIMGQLISVLYHSECPLLSIWLRFGRQMVSPVVSRIQKWTANYPLKQSCQYALLMNHMHTVTPEWIHEKYSYSGTTSSKNFVLLKHCMSIEETIVLCWLWPQLNLPLATTSGTCIKIPELWSRMRVPSQRLLLCSTPAIKLELGSASVPLCQPLRASFIIL